MILTELVVEPAELEARTGWAIKPLGACLGDICVPLPERARRDDGRIRAEALTERLGMPLVADPDHKVWALGPATKGTGRVLTTAVAPDLVLPDADGKPFDLSSLHGKKVVLVAWASW
jgi:hypothetical protein